MQGPIGFTEVVTIPPGAQPGQQRIVIDGTRGAIFEYGAGPGNPLASSWAASAGTDPFGTGYPQGFNIGPTSVFAGINFIIDSTGIFFYSGTPATGNLIGSWTNTAPTGTDGFSNVTYPGIAIYISGTVIEIWNGALSIFDPAFLPVNKGGLNLAAVGAATQEIVLTSGNVSTDHPASVGVISSATPEIIMVLNFITIVDILASMITLNAPVTVVGNLTLDANGFINTDGNQFFVQGPFGTSVQLLHGHIFLNTATLNMQILQRNSGTIANVSGAVGDTDTYDTQTFRITLPNTSITAATPSFTSIGAAKNVSANAYHVRVRGIYQGTSATATTPRFSFATPATSSVNQSLTAEFTPNSVSGTGTNGGGVSVGGTGPVAAPSISSTAPNQYIVDLEFEATFSAAGTIQFQANNSGQTYTWVGGLMEVSPVG